MKDVKRYSAPYSQVNPDEDGLYVLLDDYDAVLSKLAAETLRANTAEAELVSANSDKEAYAQNAIDLRKRAEAAEQRIANLKGLLEEALGSVYAEGRRAETAFSIRLALGLADRIEAALNPKPEAGSHE